MSWARRSRLEPFKKLATTLKDRMAGVVRGMLDGRSNAYVEAMNGMLQQVKRAARGFRTVKNFVAIAYLRMSKLKNLPQNPMQPAAPLRSTIYRAGRSFPLKTHRAQFTRLPRRRSLMRQNPDMGRGISAACQY